MSGTPLELIVVDKVKETISKLQFIEMLMGKYKLPELKVREFFSSTDKFNYELYILEIMGDAIEVEHPAIQQLIKKGITAKYLTKPKVAKA